MRERCHRAAAAVGRQAGHGGALQQEGQQFRGGEDARDQLAVAQVVARQRGLVLGEHAVDGVHAVIRVVDRLAFAQQGLRHRLQAERRETPRGGAQRLDAVDDQPPGRRREIVLLPGVLAPLHLGAAPAQPQRHLELHRVGLQHAQVELD
ncbi:hypothetical protein D3C86_1207830 [compost metagenome]